MRAHGIKNYLVGAMDQPMLEVLVKHKINTFSMSSGLTTKDFLPRPSKNITFFIVNRHGKYC